MRFFWWRNHRRLCCYHVRTYSKLGYNPTLDWELSHARFEYYPDEPEAGLMTLHFSIPQVLVVKVILFLGFCPIKGNRDDLALFKYVFQTWFC